MIMGCDDPDGTLSIDTGHGKEGAHGFSWSEIGGAQGIAWPDSVTLVTEFRLLRLRLKAVGGPILLCSFRAGS